MTGARFARAFFIFGGLSHAGLAHAEHGRFLPCETKLRPIVFEASTIVPDLQTLVGDPEFLLKVAHARVVLTTGVITQLRQLATDPNYEELVATFQQSLDHMELPTTERPEVDLPNGGTLVIENRNFVPSLGEMNVDPEDPLTKLLAVAHAWREKDESTELVTNDKLLQFTAASIGVRARGHDAYNPLTDPNARDVFPIDVTNAQMREFLDRGEVPLWAGFEDNNVQPNQFVQMTSPSTRGSRMTIARYVYERPLPIIGRPTWINGAFKAGEDIDLAYADTIRVIVEGEEFPRVDRNPRGDGGWRFDPATNLIHFEGAPYPASEGMNVEIFAQQRPHRLQKILSFEKHGVPGHARKFEQMMAIDLFMDQSIDCVIIIGDAGTAKTYLAAAAADTLHKKKKVEHIKLLRPPRHLGGHNSGTLPGDGDAKNAPWWGGLIDNLRELEKARKGKEVSMSSLPDHFKVLDFGYTRSRSLSSTLMLMDEAQNSTRGEMLTITTRLGRDSRIFMLGDVSKNQVDDPMLLSPSNNGLAAAVLRYHMPHVSLEEKSRVAILHVRHVSRSRFAEMSGRVFGIKR